MSMKTGLARDLLRPWLTSTIGLVFAVSAFFNHAVAASTETIRSGGTGASIGLMYLLAESSGINDYNLAMEIVPNLGSGGGIRAVTKGIIDVSVSTRPLTAEETARGLTSILLCRTPFILVTANSNNSALTLKDIADIYNGKLINWSDGERIRLVLRPKNDSDTRLLRGFSPAVRDGLNKMMERDGMVTMITDQNTADYIEKIPGALGTSSLSLVLSEKRPLYPIAIDGNQPDIKSLADGSYPFFKALHLVFKQNPNNKVSRFIDFIHTTKMQSLLIENGCLPFESPKAASL